MTKPNRPFLLLLVAAAAAPAALRAQPNGPGGATPAPGPDQQVAALETSCAGSAAARAERHARTPLYERLRGSEGIHALTREIVRLHLQNPAIRQMFAATDPDTVAEHVALFMIAGTGGPKVYQGPELSASHRRLKLTNADFMAAGADVIQAMKNLKYGPDETDEVVCTLVALRAQVVPTLTAEEKP